MWNTLLTHTPLLYLTQSLWRDEAFSVILAHYPPHEIAILTAQDFTPPLYYVLLSVWIYAFGTTEIVVRLLSFVFYLVCLRGCYVLAKEIHYKLPSYFPAVVTFLMAINPMIVYYGFEARAYMLAVMLSVWSLYWFIQKRYVLWTVCSILMLYTHPYTVFALVVMGIYPLIMRNKKLLVAIVPYAMSIFIAYIPWLVAIYFQILRSESMWFYPVDMNLVGSILSNMYTGFEGTPPSFWKHSIGISVCILGSIAVGYPWRMVKRHVVVLLFLWLFVPLCIVIGISFYKPVFVARYLLYVTVAEVFLITIGLMRFTNRTVQVAGILSISAVTLWFNWWYAPYHAKVDFRSTFDVVNTLYNPGDIIVSETALSFFESVYYATDTEAVFLYNPGGETLPPYVGAILIPAEKMLKTVPEGKTVFMIHENGTFTLYL